MSNKNKNGKIFSEEDFDKPSSKGNWFLEHLKQVIGSVLVAIVILCVIGFWVLPKSGNNEEKEPVKKNVEIVSTESVENVPSDSATDDVVVDNGTRDETAVSSDETSVDPDSNEQGSLTVSSDDTNVATTISSTNSNISNDVEAEAMTVIRGDYGNGLERKNRLGIKYQPIQNRVNELKREGVF